MLDRHPPFTQTSFQNITSIVITCMDFSLQLTMMVSLLFLIWYAYVVGKRRVRRDDSKAGAGGKEAPLAPGAWPIIGHLHLLGSENELIHQVLGVMADKYGPAFNIWIGSSKAFVVSNWEVAKECFTSANDKALASRPFTVSGKHMAYDNAAFSFTPYGPFWREMRKIATHELLSRSRLEKLTNVRVSEINMGMRELYNSCVKNSSQPIELKQWISNLTLNMVVRMVAGKRYFGATDDEAMQFQKTIKKFLHLAGIFVVSDALPSLRWIDVLIMGHEKAMKQTGKELDDILGGWLQEHRKRRDSGEVKADADLDFIDVMLSLQEDGQLSDKQYDIDTSIKATCLPLILGGSGSAGTLTWAISLLLNNHQALKKGQEEVDLNVGMDRQVEDSDIKNLVYLQAIIKEVLRLYPAGPLLGPRECIQDCNVAGYHVSAGTRLIINAYKIHRDPRVWEDPCAFIPERFLTTHASMDPRGHNPEFIPFSTGRRSCPGMSFALQVLHLTLARLLHAFDFATPSNEPVDLTESPGINIPKATPLQVLLTPRPAAKLYA